MIRLGKIEDLKKLWGDGNLPTQKYFINGIKSGRQEFWVMEDEEDNALIGELHIFWDSEDKDEANGINRAYLCAYRIKEKYRGKGLGRILMNRVIQRIKDKGFEEATIGVYEDSEELIKMYNSCGFDEYIKTKDIDHHNIDEKGNPKKEKPCEIYLYKFE